MEKIDRYSCGAGDGMYDNKEGYYVKYEDHKKVVDGLMLIINLGDIGNVRLSLTELIRLTELAVQGYEDAGESEGVYFGLNESEIEEYKILFKKYKGNEA